MRRARAAALLAGLLALLACPAREEPAGPGEWPAAPLLARAPEPLSPELVALCPLEPRWSAPWVRACSFQVAWTGGFTARLLRRQDGWELLEGRPHLRVSYLLHSGRRLEAPMIEWLRVEGSSLVVTHRRLAGHTHRLEPPLPWLVAPLAEGQAWTWTGTVDGVPARVETRVRRTRWRGQEGLLAVDQEGAVDGAPGGTRTTFVLPGVGVVGEEARFASEPGKELQAGLSR